MKMAGTTGLEPAASAVTQVVLEIISRKTLGKRPRLIPSGLQSLVTFPRCLVRPHGSGGRMRTRIALSLVVCCLLVSCQDGKKPPEPKTPEEVPTEPSNQCSPDFVTKRMQASWYEEPQVKFGPAVACDKPKSAKIQKSTSIPIYWINASKAWTADEVKSKLDAASEWFKLYCITLDFRPITIAHPEKLVTLVN